MNRKYHFLFVVKKKTCGYNNSKKVGKSYYWNMEVFDMLTELRQKSQITIPKEIVTKLGLAEGDKLNIMEKDGAIYIMPVAVYQKKYLDDLKDEINDVKEKLKSGEQPVFDNLDTLFDKLEE